MVGGVSKTVPMTQGSSSWILPAAVCTQLILSFLGRVLAYVQWSVIADAAVVDSYGSVATCVERVKLHEMRLQLTG